VQRLASRDFPEHVCLRELLSRGLLSSLPKVEERKVRFEPLRKREGVYRKLVHRGFEWAQGPRRALRNRAWDSFGKHASGETFESKTFEATFEREFEDKHRAPVPETKRL
jgi:hypothetical protein